MSIISKTVTVKCPECQKNYVSIFIMDQVLSRSEVAKCPACDTEFVIKCTVHYAVVVSKISEVGRDIQ